MALHDDDMMICILNIMALHDDDMMICILNIPLHI